MIKFILIGSFIWVINPLYAQHTRSVSNDSTNREAVVDHYRNAIVVVPYRPNLYHSQIDKKLVEANPNYNIQYIRNTILENLALELKIRFKMRYSGHQVMAILPEAEDTKDVFERVCAFKLEDYVFYQAPGNQVKQDSSALDKMKQKYFQKEEEKNKNLKDKSYISQGQIQASKESSNKYMSAKIIQRDSLIHMFGKPVDAYLFLNQVDLLYKIEPGSPVQKYILQVHYSFLNKGLMPQHWGIEQIEFTDTELSLNLLTKQVLSPLCKNLSEPLVVRP